MELLIHLKVAYPSKEHFGVTQRLGQVRRFEEDYKQHSFARLHHKRVLGYIGYAVGKEK